jgi:sigma-B regulation protein RsbU (phosphoserine phosphatase)
MTIPLPGKRTGIMSDMQGKLLVVDDNEMNRDMLSRRLARRKHTVMTAENGQQALDMIEKESFDVVLLDIMMPGISGIEVLKTLRQSYASADLPIIMATAKSENEDMVEALKLGANDYVTKPLNFPVVLARVNTQLSLKRSQDALKSAHDRMKRDLEAAAQIQNKLLPHDLPESDTVSIAWKYHPCDELAGDFLNVFRVNEKEIALYIVDVMGHGVPAALFAFSVSIHLNSFSGPNSILFDAGSSTGAAAPAVVLSRLNERFPLITHTGRYFTLLYGLLNTDTHSFRCANAGHPCPLIVTPEHRINEIDISGNPIGLLEKPEFDEATVQLNPGERIYLYSDGLEEERNPSGQPFEMEGIEKAIKASASQPLEASIAHLVESAVDWHGSEHLSDDLSIIGIEIKQ